ncbi:carboxypeptidase B-like [Scyliorhinus torazame]|uniref:carboxypeptidase B-like n=1 Tax=Scyliorhinus torazame TaxID=75743 RepID=UPI003B5AA7BE
MKAFFFLGFVAAFSVGATVGKYAGDKVLRLKPENEEHLQYIRDVSHSAKVDFWKPHSVELVTTNRSVDFRVDADRALDIQAGLEKIGLKYDILIEDVQSLMEKQFDGNKMNSTGYNYEKYHRWDEINCWIAKITVENPTLISRFDIGRSYEGRHIYLLRVGKRTGHVKPAIFLDCGIHAREWISPAFCQWFVKEAVRSYGSDSAMTNLLNKLDFLVVPVINVDGYVYSWTKDRFWRKTRSRNPGSHCVGTDPNRNFDAKWCSIGASRNPCADIYCGSHAESEQEVKAVANFIRNYKSIKAYLTIHSYSQMCLFPYSYTYLLTSNYKELDILAYDAVKALSSLHGTRYEYGPASIIIYPSAGGSDDWAYDLGIKYSFTFELRDTGKYGFLLPESQIRPTCEETMLAINYIATYVLNHPY